jgi:hypothetical protein
MIFAQTPGGTKSSGHISHIMAISIFQSGVHPHEKTGKTIRELNLISVCP